MTNDHPDLLALLPSVLAAPADDVPRLAYADRLEELALEQGDEPCPRGCRRDGPYPSVDYECPACDGTGRVPNHFAARAEFIRVQCELVRTPATFTRTRGREFSGFEQWQERNPKYDALRKRERELFQFHGTAWAFRPDDWENRCCSIEGRDTPAVLFRRGFVAEVRCPLAAWLGERCGRCRGDGRVGWRVGRGGLNTGPLIARRPAGNVCPDCRSTGYVGGVAAAVCGSQPVERVTLSDKEPMEMHGRFWWQTADMVIDQPYRLPRVLGPHLTGDRLGPMQFHYPTRRAALDALSAAALAVGREWAGLVTARP